VPDRVDPATLDVRGDDVNAVVKIRAAAIVLVVAPVVAEWVNRIERYDRPVRR